VADVGSRVGFDVVSFHCGMSMMMMMMMMMVFDDV